MGRHRLLAKPAIGDIDALSPQVHPGGFIILREKKGKVLNRSVLYKFFAANPIEETEEGKELMYRFLIVIEKATQMGSLAHAAKTRKIKAPMASSSP